jgi:hypothetical protein
MAAAGLCNPLTQRILRVEHEAGAALRHHPAAGLRVHFSSQNLLDIEGKQLQSVGIDSPQVGGDQRLRSVLGPAGRHARGG